MRKFAYGFVALYCMAGAALAVWADEAHKAHHHDAHHAQEGAAATFTGEVVDLACYLSHGGAGKEHQKCAKQCILGGNPAGLLTPDGTVLLLVEDHKSRKAYQAAQKLAGDQAKITGKLAEKGGMKGLVVGKVEPVKG